MNAFGRAILENSVLIARSPEDVYDYLIDMRNEQQWNDGLKTIVMRTESPVRVGTVFEAEWKGSGINMVRCTMAERPSEWAYFAENPRMDIRFSGTVAAVPEGSQLAIRMELVPRGPMKILLPVLRRSFQRQEVSNLRSIKAAMEA
jgi:hypothetical protein